MSSTPPASFKTRSRGEADEDQFAKLIVHEHPQHQGPITLDVLPEEQGELPESDQYVSIEVIGPGERSGQRAVVSVERFNQLAAGGDLNAILMDAVAGQQPHRPAQPRRRGRGRGAGDGHAADGQARGGRGKVEWGPVRVPTTTDTRTTTTASTANARLAVLGRWSGADHAAWRDPRCQPGSALRLT